MAALSKGGKNIPVEKALDCVYAYAVGLDMTRRDLQRAMGDEKKPWEIGKSFDRSARSRRANPSLAARRFSSWIAASSPESSARPPVSSATRPRRSAIAAKYGWASGSSRLVNSRSMCGPPKRPGGRPWPNLRPRVFLT